MGTSGPFSMLSWSGGGADNELAVGSDAERDEDESLLALPLDPQKRGITKRSPKGKMWRRNN